MGVLRMGRNFLLPWGALKPKDGPGGCAPDPAEGAHDASPDTVVGWGRDTTPQTLTPRHALGCRCFFLFTSARLQVAPADESSPFCA